MPRFGLPSPFGLARRRNSELRLGRLEREVLDRIWTHGDTDASGMQSALASDRPIALSTVQSTLERLHRKRLLLRQKRGRAYRYAAAITREELIGDLVDGV
uniref:BlaI/MecI/CopY family transcriptional regulator n=1 Tax=uncultured Abyssibacter sp. TaxID=2320202 RepID=UPI0032B27460